jgi:hypothetical protein
LANIDSAIAHIINNKEIKFSLLPDTLEGCRYTNEVRLRGLRKNKLFSLPSQALFV